MIRAILMAGVIWASLPAALCQAACAPEPAAAAMPCHDSGAEHAPTQDRSDDDCLGCGFDLAVGGPAPLAAAMAPTLALPAPPAARPVMGAHGARFGASREPPGGSRSPYARTHAPLLN